MPTAPLLIRPPAPALAPFVQHYWLSLHNTHDTTLVRPDGCVDVVLEVDGSRWRGRCFGSTTRATRLACLPGRHYLGIRFRPGMGRHFIDARADALTDRVEDAQSLLDIPLEPFAEGVVNARVFDDIDRQLGAWLQQHAPAMTPADRAVREIRATHGALRIDDLATRLGRSRRQLERQFVETVGVTAKFFCTVVRADRAVALMSRDTSASLAQIAAEAGYADQSHMTRDFERLQGESPARRRVAFLQDDGQSPMETGCMSHHGAMP